MVVNRVVAAESGPVEINVVSVVVVSAAVVPIKQEHTELIRSGANPQAVM